MLDIILESFEARPHLDKLFISLIKNYMGDPHVISEVIGFKLGNMEILDNYKEPQPLLTVIALLLQHQVIALDDIYLWVRHSTSTHTFQTFVLNTKLSHKIVRFPGKSVIITSFHFSCVRMTF